MTPQEVFESVLTAYGLVRFDPAIHDRDLPLEKQLLEQSRISGHNILAERQKTLGANAPNFHLDYLHDKQLQAFARGLCT
jgi:hypothetical protein